MNNDINLNNITTEKRNVNSYNIDRLNTQEIVTLINNEDKKVADAVALAIPQMTQVVDKMVFTLSNDGRIIYIGAGTSGRIAAIDAVECLPTYSVGPDKIMCLMAGGTEAFIRAIEGAEDRKDWGVRDLKDINLSSKDMVIGLAASGRTPYVIGALEYAKEIGAITACITTSCDSQIAKIVDFPIEAITGSEVITGSTRMKSGTAQKMICNILSTSTMVKMGKVYENLMIDVVPTNEKLHQRAIYIITEITGISKDSAQIYLKKYNTVKKALFSILTKIDNIDEINKYLDSASGSLRQAIDKALKKS